MLLAGIPAHPTPLLDRPSHRAAVLCVACAQLIHITTHSGAGATGTGKDGVQREGWSSVKEVKGLAKLLLKPSPARLRGTHEAQGVLIRADPGTGKTWSMNQLTHHLAESLKADSKEAGIKLVPLLVPVQQLAKHVAEPNPLLAFIRARFKGNEREALLVAYELRALIVLLDGVRMPPLRSPSRSGEVLPTHSALPFSSYLTAT